MKPIALMLGAALLSAGTAACYSVPLDLKQCTAMPAGAVTALGSDWAVLARHVQRCRVPGPDGRVALLVDIVRLDRASEDAAVKEHGYGAVPLPVLRDPQGRIVGRLPEGFPVDPPGELKVRFNRWQGAMPQEIALFEAGESALAPHALASLHWDARSKSYR